MLRFDPLDPYLNGLDPSARARIEAHNGRVLVGDSTDWTTPLIPDGDADFWRARWRDVLLGQVLDDRYPWLNEAEMEQAEKIGPWSIVLPWSERVPDLKRYFNQKEDVDDSSSLRRGFQALLRIIPKGLKPYTVQQGYDEMPTGTNLGAPFFTSDRRYRPAVFAIAAGVAEDNFVAYDKEDPATLYWRGQPRGLGETPKQRVVWGYPHWLTILELMIQGPLLRELRKRPEFAAWASSERVDQVITGLLKNPVSDILSVDFSGYDATVPEILIRYAFEAIRFAFGPEARNLIDLVEERFLNIRMETPNGLATGRKGGVPSGSGDTNLVDTFCQIILHHAVADALGLRIDGLTCQGDDGVVRYGSRWKLADITEAVMGMFGMQISSDKGGVSRDTVRYLQNVHSTKYIVNNAAVGVRPLMRILNGMMSYERPVKKGVWNGYLDTIRWWQQCESGRFHPKFPVLVRFLFDHDKYSCMPVNEVLDKAGGLSKVKSALRQRSFPYGKEPLEGLRGFRTIQILSQICGGRRDERRGQ